MQIEFINQLSQRLQEELPGIQAHQKLMPQRKGVQQLNLEELKPKKSAVLVLLYLKKFNWHTVFIQRTKYKGVHSGQIAFPGGKHEKEDKSLMETALREAEEELAIPSQQVEIIGQLSSIYVPPSNFLIAPFVGYTNQTIEFIPEQKEVESFIEVELNDLIGEDKIEERAIMFNTGLNQKVLGYPIQEQIIWGATGMMVKEFAEILEPIIK